MGSLIGREKIVVDIGTAPEIFIEGLAYYEEHDGIVRTGYFVHQPSMIRNGCMTRVLALRMICTLETQQQMRQKVVSILSRSAVN